MSARRILTFLAIALAASLTIACGGKSEPEASGVSTGTPAPVTSTPEKGKATAQGAGQTESTLVKGLLQRTDVPGSGWTVQDISARELAAATQEAAGQSSTQDLQGLVATCDPC